MKKNFPMALLSALVLSCVGCSEDMCNCGDSESISTADGNYPVRVPGANGGYWWSYKDGAGSQVQPESDLTHPFPFAEPGKIKRAAWIRYDILPEPTDTALRTTWEYRDSAGSLALPGGGMGFSFKNGNAVFSIPKSKLGIRFWAKGKGASIKPGITVEFPTTDTEVALDGDRFTTSCTCGMRGGKSCLADHGATETATVGAPEMHTCFAHFYYGLELTSDWRSYVVLFRDLKWADDGMEHRWVDRALLNHKLDGTEDPVGWDRRKALKVQFAASRPGPNEESAHGELWIDDVRWVVARDGLQGSGYEGDLPREAP